MLEHIVSIGLFKHYVCAGCFITADMIFQIVSEDHELISTNGFIT